MFSRRFETASLISFTITHKCLKATIKYVVDIYLSQNIKANNVDLKLFTLAKCKKMVFCLKRIIYLIQAVLGSSLFVWISPFFCVFLVECTYGNI